MSGEQLDFLSENICKRLRTFVGLENVEIEARLCLLTEQRGNSRVRLPIDSAAVLLAPHKISVGMQSKDFDAIKTLLTSLSEAMTVTSSESTTSTFGELRVTKDETGKITCCMKKKKLATIDIVVPGYPYDLRIGVAQEIPVDPSEIQGSAQYTRRRVRTCFKPKGSEMSYELTTVTVGSEVTHECEIELMFDKLAVDGKWVSELVRASKDMLDCVKASKVAPTPAVDGSKRPRDE